MSRIFSNHVSGRLAAVVLLERAFQALVFEAFNPAK
jgi:hypothetical protein